MIPDDNQRHNMIQYDTVGGRAGQTSENQLKPRKKAMPTGLQGA